MVSGYSFLKIDSLSRTYLYFIVAVLQVFVNATKNLHFVSECF